MNASASNSRIDWESQDVSLPEIARVNKEAQLDGILFGSAAGSLSGFLSLKLFRLTPRVSTLSGLIAGAAAGYMVSQQAATENLVKLKTDKARQQREAKDAPDGEFYMNRGEPGAGGLESLHDKYATTRGDH